MLKAVQITIVRIRGLHLRIVSFVKDCEKQLSEAEDCFKQCDIEIRMLPSSTKESVSRKVDALRKECESKRRQIANLKVQVERNDLLGGAAVWFCIFWIIVRHLVS